jgi:hypothetical protein
MTRVGTDVKASEWMRCHFKTYAFLSSLSLFKLCHIVTLISEVCALSRYKYNTYHVT